MGQFDSIGDSVSLKSSPTNTQPNTGLGGMLDEIGDSVKLKSGGSLLPNHSQGGQINSIGDKVSLDSSASRAYGPMSNRATKQAGK
jgi:hypothetical protein